MAKKNQSAIVSINVATLNCLRQLLFSDSGIDLSNIINDMSPTNEPDDLMAINVGLTFRGITPEVDNQPRFEIGWDRHYYRFNFVKYSLILNKVFYQRFEITLDDDGNSTEHIYGKVDSMDYESWISKTTTEADCRAKALKQK